MAEIVINGIPISFPFEPYEVQKDYMKKVIECIQNGENGVLESPTGTGKTLSLLCSSLAWLLVKKAQIQAGLASQSVPAHLEKSLSAAAGPKSDACAWAAPKVVYASRTHSQLSQAMAELKRSAYGHVRAAALGSRDQMCIHPEVSKETNNVNKIHMCQAKVKSRTCFFYTNVDKMKEDARIKERPVADIEDLVAVGRKLSCCPYYLSKELKQNADVLFMPYNYLLDAKARKANGVELADAVVILDEAHNVERTCEEAASVRLTSTDVALCVEEATHVMQQMAESADEGVDFGADKDSSPKDFTADDLCTLKTVLLALEKAVDEIAVTPGDGVTFEGDYVYELFSKALINQENSIPLISVVENVIQYLSLSSGNSPFQRKGTGLQKLADLLNVVFTESQKNHRRRIVESFKIHVQIEEKKTKKSDSWSVVRGPTAKGGERAVSFWCFSPGFGMKQLLYQRVRCVILTSGTLAPLAPLISELGVPIRVRLENPHIVADNQVLVRIVGRGPDGHALNSNFENRSNPKYIESLGRTILSFSRVVPDGLLVFFPSYPVLAKCQEEWQLGGIWSSICDIKQIYVEPQRKDAFNSTMSEFYKKINDPASRGACFMAVCRGKVSEGLDFADANGRAVIITGLPFPPFKDPRVVLKKKYLEEKRAKDKEYLSGDDWYSLEASRAVNQAIGRVIRHKNDYGAILLCDVRFNNANLKNRLSSWLKDRCVTSTKFGETVGELCRFFKNAEKSLPSPKLKPLNRSEDFSNDVKIHFEPRRKIIPRASQKTVSENTASESKNFTHDMDYYKNTKDFVFDRPKTPKKASDLFDALDKSNSAPSKSPASGLLENGSNKRELSEERSDVAKSKKKKLKMIMSGSIEGEPSTKKAPEDLAEFVKCVKSSLEKESYKAFQGCISSYKTSNDFADLILALDSIFFERKSLHYLLKGMERFVKGSHRVEFQEYCKKLS